MQLFTVCYECQKPFLIFEEAAGNVSGFSGCFYSKNQAAGQTRMDPTEVKAYCRSCRRSHDLSFIELVVEISRE